VRYLLAAIAFLTRFPVPGAASIDAADVARSAGWFPLVGVLLGGTYAGAAALLRTHFPMGVVAVIVVLLDVVFTGALHFDGLADTADGFGGGKNREDVLRIMRDHAIGSYGGAALVLAMTLKIAAIAALLGQSHWASALILTPALGRWSILLLTASLPYARSTESLITGIGKRPLLWGTGLIAISLIAATSLRAWIALGAVPLVSAGFGWYCRRRIAGITGDTLGANLELCESIALLAFIWAPQAN